MAVRKRCQEPKPAVPLTPEEADERALEAAFRLLGYRQRSEAELRRRLEQRGFPPAAVAHAVATLKRLDLLDDLAFAEHWVAARPDRGPHRLKQELQQKGIDGALAEKTIREGVTAERELASAWAVAWRATRAQAVPLDRQELLRIRRMLQRRGFAGEVVNRVCARLNDQVSADGEWLGDE